MKFVPFQLNLTSSKSLAFVIETFISTEVFAVVVSLGGVGEVKFIPGLTALTFNVLVSVTFSLPESSSADAK